MCFSLLLEVSLVRFLIEMVHTNCAAMDQQFRTVLSMVHWSLNPVHGSRRMGTLDPLG